MAAAASAAKAKHAERAPATEVKKEADTNVSLKAAVLISRRC